VASKTSPVTGEKFQTLSKEYKKTKQANGLNGVADLQFSGDMLDSLDFNVTKTGIEIGVFGVDAPKADGHNNLSGDSKLPTRQFIPAEGEGFVSSIEREVDRIIADAVSKDSKPDLSTLGLIESKAELYAYITPLFGLASRSEVRLAVLRSDVWTRALSDLGLLGLL